MTPKITQRIAQLQHGEIPDGYKRGKLGIVPMEWDDVPFASLFVSTSDYTDDLETYPLYSLTLEDGITAKTERYDRGHLVKKSESYKILRPNNFAYNPMNIRLGAVARHKGSFPVAVSGYYDIFTTVSPDDLAFMDSFLTCAPMITYYNKVSTGSLLEKQRVHFSQFLEFSLPLPPLEERKKIGAILSAQDKIIELKERLIAEKRRQKKWLMQRLLTRKQRLPGFSGEWLEVSVGYCIREYKQLSNDVVSIPIYSSSRKGLMPQSEYYDQKEAAETNLGYKVVPSGYVTYRHMSDDDIFHFNINQTGGEVLVSSEYPVFTSSGKCNLGFLIPMLNGTARFRYFCRTQKLGGTRTRLYFKNLVKYRFRLPPLDEQTAIADILSAADREIELLRASLEQEKRKKKALSQLLLTGIVRCISNE